MRLNKLLWHVDLFCMKEFVIMTGLSYHPPSEPLFKVTPLKKLKENKTSKSVKTEKKDIVNQLTNTKINNGKEKINNESELLTIVGPSYKVNNLFVDLKNKKGFEKAQKAIVLSLICVFHFMG